MTIEALIARFRNLNRRSRLRCRFSLLLVSVDSLRSLLPSANVPPGHRFLRSPTVLMPRIWFRMIPGESPAFYVCGSGDGAIFRLRAKVYHSEREKARLFFGGEEFRKDCDTIGCNTCEGCIGWRRVQAISPRERFHGISSGSVCR